MRYAWGLGWKSRKMFEALELEVKKKDLSCFGMTEEQHGQGEGPISPAR